MAGHAGRSAAERLSVLARAHDRANRAPCGRRLPRHARPVVPHILVFQVPHAVHADRARRNRETAERLREPCSNLSAVFMFLVLYAAVYLLGIAFYEPVSGTGTARFLLTH